jgi:ribonuclease BN (tRNA processing enzyme)
MIAGTGLGKVFGAGAALLLLAGCSAGSQGSGRSGSPPAAGSAPTAGDSKDPGRPQRAAGPVANAGSSDAPASPGSAPDNTRCPEQGVAVQVLGSGGPIADDARASSGYLVWVDGKARLLVDAGGGVMVRFAESGASFGSLSGILLTHLHVDHVADLPALLKSASFGTRKHRLPLVGPTGGEKFPSLRNFARGLFEPGEGVFRYLRGFADGSGQPFSLEAREVDTQDEEPTVVLETEELTARSVGVPHGVVPALGYVVEVGDVRIGFTGDQRMDEARFTKMIRGVDLLVAHHAIAEDAGKTARKLHAPPSAIGALAGQAEVGKVVLSHHMARSLRKLDGAKKLIRKDYEGPVVVASDLQCMAVEER